MSPVPIYTPGWRETKWSKIPCLKKQRDRQSLTPGPPDADFKVFATQPHTPPHPWWPNITKLILAMEEIFHKHWLNFLKSPIIIISYNLKQRESNLNYNTLYCSELQKIPTNINLEQGNNIVGSTCSNNFVVFTDNYWNPPQWQLSSPFQLPWQLPWMDATTGNPTWTSMHEIITENSVMKPPKLMSSSLCICQGFYFPVVH